MIFIMPNISVLFIILLVPLGSYSQNFPIGGMMGFPSISSCDEVENKLLYNYESLKAQSQKGRVQSVIAGIQDLAQRCNFKLEKLGISSATLAYWERKGKETSLGNLKRKIESASSYENVDAKIDEYVQIAKELGVSSKDIAQFVGVHQKQGRAADLQEEKNCQPSYDLRNEILGPPRNQDSIGWCYAFSGADLLSYKLGKRISAADLAINYNDNWLNNLGKKMGFGETDFDGGWEEPAIAATAKKGGACLEQNLRSEDNGYSSLFNTLTKIEETKRGLAKGSACYDSITATYPNLPEKDYVEVVEKTSRAEVVRALSDKACGPRIPLNDIKVEVMTKSAEKNFKTIDEQLAQGNIVSVAYNVHVLVDPDDMSGKPNHASVLVGRKYDKKTRQCQYLIRNSWGRGCGSYSESWKCEEGNVWVSKEALSRGLYGVTYLK
ncbi:Papain family cysteine protease [compost metagenome]